MTARFFGTDQPPEAGPEAPAAPDQPENSGMQGEAPARSTTEQRLALLIGNARYKTAPLVNPVQDVRLLGQVLASLGFAVTVVENAGRTKLREKLADFVARLNEAGGNSVAFLYFAGHGLQDGGINFLLPVDLELSSRPHLRALALPVDEVVTELAHVPRKANVIVLDACRLPPKDSAAEPLDMTQGLASLKLPPDGMLVVYSTAAGAVAEDGKAANSPYAAALAQSLPGVLTPDRRFHEVFVEAAERVRADTEGRQNPSLYLQGTLPALAVTEEDRERFRTWVFRSPKTWRERTLQWSGVGFLALLALGSAIAWFASNPEQRALFLHNLHVVRNPELFEFSCKGPKDHRDRFGLTRQDWCAKDINELVRIVKSAGSWDARVGARMAANDPGAMTLRAAEIALSKPAPGSIEMQQALTLAVRAANAGWLPAWPVVQQTYFSSSRNERLIRSARIYAGLVKSANGGVVHAWIEGGKLKWFDGDVKLAERLLSQADRRDATGAAALAAAILSMTGSPRAGRAPDVAKAVKWFKQACRKGVGDALTHLDVLARRRIATFSSAERAACVKKIIERDGPEGHFQRGLELTKPGSKMNYQAAAEEFLKAAERGLPGAKVQLAILHIMGLLSEHSRPMIGLDWLRQAAGDGNMTAKSLLGEAMILGMPDANGQPRIKIDIKAGRALLEEAMSAFEPLAALSLALLHETGAFGRRDPREVQRLARILKDFGSGNVALEAKAAGLEARAMNEIKLRRYHQDRIRIGRRSAPTKVIVLVPWGCAGCLDFLRIELPRLASEYADKGFIEIEIRPVYGAGAGVMAAEADAFIRCVAPRHRAELLLKLIETFDAWSGLAEADKARQLADLTAPFAAGKTCRQDQKSAAILRSRGPNSAKLWGVTGDLVVAVNGEMLSRPDPPAVRKAIYLMAGPLVRPKLALPPNIKPR